MAPHWYESLALKLTQKNQLNEETIAALRAVHDLTVEAYAPVAKTLNVKYVAGAIIAAAGLIAAQVPKEALGPIDQTHLYRWHQLIVAGGLFIILLTTIAMIAFLSWSERRRRRGSKVDPQEMRFVLEYCAAICKIRRHE
jgi:hypothetical protein